LVSSDPVPAFTKAVLAIAGGHQSPRQVLLPDNGRSCRCRVCGERPPGTSAGMGSHREEEILEAPLHGKSGSGRKCGKADGIPFPVIEKILAREPDLRVMRRPPGDRKRPA